MANIQRATDSSSLAEVISTILDKGIVIDAWATVSLVGIQILSIEARIVIASVETYLKYAEAIGLMGGSTSRALKSAATPLPATTGAAMPAATAPGVAVPVPA